MVDNISKPFTFTANTYAKASEVNADFDTLYTGVNACVNQINANIADINNLNTDKADINGNSTQRFSVADPTVNTDAVNKQSLMRYISNSLDYISGLVISKDSSSPNDTIIVSAGSCYDSTKTVVLSLDSSTSKQNLNQGASTTYYVYIIGNDTGSSVDILISPNSTTPTLPSGYTKYRQIGHYTTNSDSEIEYIYQQSSSKPDTRATIIETYINGKSWYRIWSDKWCEQGGNVTVSSSINVTFLKPFANTDYNIVATLSSGSPSNYEPIIIDNRSVDECRVVSSYSRGADWFAQGYIS